MKKAAFYTNRVLSQIASQIAALSACYMRIVKENAKTTLLYIRLSSKQLLISLAKNISAFSILIRDFYLELEKTLVSFAAYVLEIAWAARSLFVLFLIEAALIFFGLKYKILLILAFLFLALLIFSAITMRNKIRAEDIKEDAKKEDFAEIHPRVSLCMLWSLRVFLFVFPIILSICWYRTGGLTTLTFLEINNINPVLSSVDKNTEKTKENYNDATTATTANIATMATMATPIQKIDSRIVIDGLPNDWELKNSIYIEDKKADLTNLRGVISPQNAEWIDIKSYRLLVSGDFLYVLLELFSDLRISDPETGTVAYEIQLTEMPSHKASINFTCSYILGEGCDWYVYQDEWKHQLNAEKIMAGFKNNFVEIRVPLEDVRTLIEKEIYVKICSKRNVEIKKEGENNVAITFYRMGDWDIYDYTKLEI